MRVVMTTFGSLGDLHPYIAIALGLRARGHQVVIATSGYYREKVEALGLSFHAIRPDAEVVRKDPELLRRVMDRKVGSRTIIKDIVMPLIRESYDDLSVACEGADLVVGHMLAFGARLVSEKTGIRWASVVLQPIGLFSAWDPPLLPDAPFLRYLRFLGAGFHALVFRIGRKVVKPWTEPWHRLRADLGLPATEENPVFEGQHSPDLVLALFSPLLASKQPDWPAASLITGFPFYDSDGSEGLSPELARFLDAGPAPIVFTLGSSAVMDPGSFYSVGADAARALRRRAVLLVGRDAAPASSTLPEGVAAFDYAPYSQLFPRCAAIIHQGGIGTTGQAMRSGRPMLVMPYAHDQPDNAARICRLGIGRTISRARFTLPRATREIGRLLDDPGYSKRAAEVGAAVSREDGAAIAADAIERLLDLNATSSRAGSR
jgi:rhamnosyltransferase subunit B